MDYAKFVDMLDRLFLVYRVSMPNQAQTEAIYERVMNIPEQAMRAIFQNIEDTCDNIPRNLPKAIKAGWNNWKGANPELINYQRQDCTACSGTGHLIAHKDGHDYVFRCGHCENWRGQIGESAPVATINEIMDAGYYFDAPKPTKEQVLKYYPKHLVNARLKKMGASIDREPAYKEFDSNGNIYPFRPRQTA